MRATVIFSLLLALFSLTESLAADDEPRVTIGQGTLVGKTMTSRLGKEFLAFQGIPYAAPPVGQLRFREPQETATWKGERNAQKEGEDCMHLHFKAGMYRGSEDCLFLNIYAPKVGNKSRGLPVMVWIHGGGFSYGSGSTFLYGPELLLDHEIVLVTINYRLGMFGYLNLGAPEAPGNYGLKDQVAALKWVKNNIAAFGGNSDSVTIFGNSAGGASVHYLLVSPLAQGLFHRAIAQSGSALNPWAYLHQSPRVGIESAANLGCTQATLSALIECLRTVPAQKLADETDVVKRKERRHLEFAPSVEPEGTVNPMLPRDVRQLPMADVPVMAGVTTHEGMMHYSTQEKPLNVSIEMSDKHDYYVMKELGLTRNSPEMMRTWQKIVNFYNDTVEGDDIEQFLMMSSDADINVGVDQMIRNAVASARQNPIFYYEFSFEGKLNFLKNFSPVLANRTGSCHADELGYLFNMNIPNLKEAWKRAPARDIGIIEKITKLWTNFATTGNPTPDASLRVIWQPVEKTSSDPDFLVTRHLDMGENLLMKQESLNEDRMKFWSQIYKEIFVQTKNEAV